MRHPPANDSLRWGLLSSTWLHLIVLVSLRTCTLDPLELLRVEPEADRPMAVLRIEAEVVIPLPEMASMGESATDQGDGDPGGTEAGAAEGDAVLALSPGPDLEALEGEAPVADVEPAGSAGLASAEAEESVGATSDAVVEVEPAEPVEGATPPGPHAGERPPPVEEPRRVDPQPALPPDDPRLVEPDPEEEPEPLPVVAEEEDVQERWKRFVDVTGMEVADAAPADAEVISVAPTEARDRARTRVTSPRAGPAAPTLDGAEENPAPPQLIVRDGSPQDPEGARSPTTRPQGGAAGGGGGRQGIDQGQGDRTPAGKRRAGGPAASAGGGSAGAAVAPRSGGRPSAAAAAAGRAEREGSPIAPEGLRPTPVEGAPWWRPSVFRIAVVRPEPVSESEPAPAPTADRDAQGPRAEASERRDRRAPSPTEVSEVAVVDRTGDEADVGGTDRPSDEEASPAEDLDPREGEADRGASEASDPIEELRKALGWGGLEREQLHPSASQSGSASSSGAPALSWQAVLEEDVPTVEYVQVSTVDTPLGKYQQRNFEEIRAAYYARDLPVELRAGAIQGETTIHFRIHASGRVSDVLVFKSSGHPALDRIALEAVPKRLHRLPRELRDEHPGGLWQRITFRYRNPVVVQEGPQ